MVLIIEPVSYLHDFHLYFRLTGETDDGHFVGGSALGNHRTPSVKVGEAAPNELIYSISRSICIYE